MKKQIAMLLVVGVIAALASSAQAAPIDAITYNNGGADLTNLAGSSTYISGDAELVSVKMGTTTYSTVGSTSNDLSGGGYAYDLTGTDPGTRSAALADEIINSGTLDAATGTEFYFSSTPGMNDLLVFFDSGSGGSTKCKLLINGTPTGNEVAASSWSVVGKHKVAAAGAGPSWDLSVCGISVSDFGLSAGQLATVTGVQLTDAASLDPFYVGVAVVPEPATMSLLVLGGLAMLRRRRRS